MPHAKNIFSKKETDNLICRINKLNKHSHRLWGKMKVSQMLAHCNVAYEKIYSEKYPRPNLLKRVLLKFFVKKAVVGKKPYPKNGRTATEFIIQGERDFDLEKQLLIDYIIKTQELGENYFNNKVSHSFGKLTKKEWNIMLYKHLNHHLSQFGV